MTSVLAIPSLFSFFKQVTEYSFYSLSMYEVCLVKSHHVYEDHVPFVHEEVAEEIEGFGLAYSAVSSLV